MVVLTAVVAIPRRGKSLRLGARGLGAAQLHAQPLVLFEQLRDALVARRQVAQGSRELSAFDSDESALHDFGDAMGSEVLRLAVREQLPQHVVARQLDEASVQGRGRVAL